MTEREDRTAMTEHEDELVSAAIDGEATPDEAAQVAADPRLAARRAVMQAAAELGATPVAPSPPEARDAAIAAALAAHDESGTDDRGGLVTSLAARRTGRSMRWVGAAAAALLVIAGATLLLRARVSDPTSTVASRAEPSSTSPGFANGAGAPDSTAAGTAGAADAAGAESFAPATFLGTFASNAELTDAIRRLAALRQPGSTSIPSTSSTTAVSCPAPLTLASIELVATALLEGRELLIFVGRIESGELVYLALDATCATSFTQSLS